MSVSRRRFMVIAAGTLAGMTLPRLALATARIWRARAFGTDVSIFLPAIGQDFYRVVRSVERELQLIEKEFSLFADSALVRLNESGILKNPGKRMRDVFEMSAEIHEATGGAFDPTVQTIWKAHASGGDLAGACARAGWRKVEHSASQIRLASGMELTFNGIAQGYAADRLRSILKREGYSDLLVNMGEIGAMGRPENTTAWQVRIADAAGQIVGQMQLKDRSLATSSPKGMLIGPQHQPHILHPDGRHPIWNTVSVSASSAALADGLSTAFCLMGKGEIETALARISDASLELCI